MKTSEKPLYVAELARRLVLEVDNRRTAKSCGSAAVGSNRFSLAKLSRDSGINYHTLIGLFVKRNRRLTLDTIDKVLYGMKLSVVDLMTAPELVTRYESLGADRRYKARGRALSGNPPGTPGTENKPEKSLDTTAPSL